MVSWVKKHWAALVATVTGVVTTVVLWIQVVVLRRKLAKAQAGRVVAEIDAAQAGADATAAKAREDATAQQAAKLAALNSEVVHVDPHGADLAGAFDRATGGRDSGLTKP